MSAPGFPSQNPRKNRGNGIRTPVNGGLMEWLSWNFSTVYDKVGKVKRDTIQDYKSSDYASQFPNSSGRTPDR